MALSYGNQYTSTDNVQKRAGLHAGYSLSPHRWQRWVFERAGLQADAAVLELGCGTGAFWLENRDCLPARLKVRISDLSPGMVQAAAASLKDLGCLAGAEEIDVVSIPHRDHSFDVVIANHMLYHAADPKRAIEEIRRVLKPSGRAVMATNGHAHLRVIDDILRSFVDGFEPNDLSSRFGLETGFSLARMVFGNVEVHRYLDALQVTDAEPLLDYIKSLPYALGPGVLAEVSRYVEGRIRAEGAIMIPKDAGVLIAVA